MISTAKAADIVSNLLDNTDWREIIVLVMVMVFFKEPIILFLKLIIERESYLEYYDDYICTKVLEKQIHK